MSDWYVDYLADMIREELDNHEELTAPLLVIASVPKSEFQEKKSDKYTYSVIGGIQRFSAIQKVNKEGGDKNNYYITQMLCIWIRFKQKGLAHQHNEFNQIQQSNKWAMQTYVCTLQS